MTTSAFKSATRRTSLGSCGGGAGADESTSTSSNSSSSTSTTTRSHRRARSLSRFSPRVAEPQAEYRNAPKGKFVNTKRGSEFPEISLDDLALELFSSPEEKNQPREGRSGRRSRELGRWASDTASSKRRGRSVSRQRDKGGGNVEGSDGRRTDLDNSSRRRSLSVVRYQVSDSESDVDISRSFRHQGKVKNLNDKSNSATSETKAAPNGRQLGRSLSQKHISLCHSRASTDDDTRGSQISKFGTEKTIQAVYAEKKSEHPMDEGSTELYEAMRKELRQAVEEIRAKVQQATGTVKTNLVEDKTDYDHVLTVIEHKYATKFNQNKLQILQSEKHKHDLLTEIKLEEQQAKELSKIIKQMGYSSKSSDAPQKRAWTTLRSNDRNRMSNKLDEEAEKYFENFASSVEDTDISSFDGERSDESSSKGGTINEKYGTTRVEAQSCQSPAGSYCHPTEADGIILPWLQWETSSDASLSGISIRQSPGTPKSLERNDNTDSVMSLHEPSSNNSKSSSGSYSPGIFDDFPEATKADNTRSNSKESGGCKNTQFDMEKYRQLQKKEELLFERFKERQRIEFGGLLLCAASL